MTPEETIKIILKNASLPDLHEMAWWYIGESTGELFGRIVDAGLEEKFIKRFDK